MKRPNTYRLLFHRHNLKRHESLPKPGAKIAIPKTGGGVRWKRSAATQASHYLTRSALVPGASCQILIKNGGPDFDTNS
ncbi:hypothetical protein BHYA_0092g00250 [Botrytis hyacinthi]|uniref:Uncharacterized protein n=1 Tax=Botrytis hyacinthi TaxID=278943 RepID=A0A4Z1GQE6_9HELO|nr:hypothetical protein BHYA_0092g00250 [Botrytis hyacinthi]